MLDALQYGLATLSGGLVGFSLGLVGGGGSILAVPLMVYLVGVASPHVAIGTSAIAVAANAGVGLANHARAATSSGRAPACSRPQASSARSAGSTLGKAVDGQKLLFASRSDGGGRRADAARRSSDAAGAETACRDNCAAGARHRRRHRRLVRVLRDRRRLPDRAGADAATGMPMLNAIGIVAGCRHRLRPDNGDSYAVPAWSTGRWPGSSSQAVSSAASAARRWRAGSPRGARSARCSQG